MGVNEFMETEEMGPSRDLELFKGFNSIKQTGLTDGTMNKLKMKKREILKEGKIDPT